MTVLKWFKIFVPELELVKTAELYIEALLSDWLEVIEQSRKNNQIDNRMVYYLWFSKNESLKNKWKATYPLIDNKIDTELFALMEENKKLAVSKQDTYDCTYSICYQKNDYIVVAMSKPQWPSRQKPAWGYHISCTKSEAPLFYERCTRQPKSE